MLCSYGLSSVFLYLAFSPLLVACCVTHLYVRFAIELLGKFTSSPKNRLFYTLLHFIKRPYYGINIFGTYANCICCIPIRLADCIIIHLVYFKVNFIVVLMR